MVALLLLGAAAAGWAWWTSRGSSAVTPPAVLATGTPIATASGVSASRPAVVAAGPTGSSPSTASAPGVVVHVVGQVRRPGVVRLAAGSRVVDAVAAAGGAVPGADQSTVNLARVLVDGEQIRVGPGSPAPPLPGQSPSGVGGAAPTSPGAVVDLNTAGLAELDSLPGVGPVLAQRILDFRSERGRFSSVDELREVSGIGEKTFADLRQRVRV